MVLIVMIVIWVVIGLLMWRSPVRCMSLRIEEQSPQSKSQSQACYASLSNQLALTHVCLSLC
jgi:hypothetical protein